TEGSSGGAANSFCRSASLFAGRKVHFVDQKTHLPRRRVHLAARKTHFAVRRVFRGLRQLHFASLAAAFFGRKGPVIRLNCCSFVVETPPMICLLVLDSDLARQLARANAGSEQGKSFSRIRF